MKTLTYDERREAMYQAIRDDRPFPDEVALGVFSHPQVRQLMLHFNRDDEMGCFLINQDEQEFIGELWMKFSDDPTYEPTGDEITTAFVLNTKIDLCLHRGN